MSNPTLDDLCINTLRTLSIDAVEKAKSGHPGAPMALAPVAYALWQNVLQYDPADPLWPNRDRFVLSNGHASALLYSMLYLAGVQEVNGQYERLGTPALSLEDLKQFRQLGSKTPGHPEYRHTTGVEATTGPLGQGAGNSVGMAMASRWLAARYNRPDFKLFDYNVYTFVGDGDMMEGLSSEAASLAGHLQLSNLCWLYDSNHVSLDGRTHLSFTEDVAARFAAYGWNVTHVEDANDLAQLAAGFEFFAKTRDRPTLIIVTTHIGYGSPKKQDTSAAHGEPLGPEETKAAKRFYGWPEDAQFLVPEGVRENFAKGIGARGRKLREAWDTMFAHYGEKHPDLHEQLVQMEKRALPDGWDQELPTFPADAKGVATRESSGQVLNILAKKIPWLMGGAADLSTSTKTNLKAEDAGVLNPENPGGRNIYFGVREHSMAAAVNGLVLSKLRAYGSTFLTFTDYCRPSIRLSALMEIPCIWIMTHDSIGLGEDGPTHQPVEHIPSLRMIPGLMVMRPADANEVTEAWRVIAQLRHEPVVLVLSRQALPTLDRTRYGKANGVAHGAYILADAADGKPDVILMSTGSEVAMCVEAYETLTSEGIKARLVSMPSWELFEKESQAYRDSVLPPSVLARVSVEQSAAFGWEHYVGLNGARIGMRTFGSSAPIKDLQKKFGFTPDHIIAAAKEQLAAQKKG